MFPVKKKLYMSNIGLSYRQISMVIFKEALWIYDA